MRAIFLLFLIFLLFPLSIFSQTPLNLDSLKQELTKHTKQDSARMLILLEIGVRLSPKDSSRQTYFQKALSIAKKNHNTHYQALLNQNIGISYKSTGNYPKAFKHLSKALEFYKKLDDYDNVGYCYNELSVIYGIQKKYDKSLALQKEGYELLKDYPPTQTLLRLMGNIVNLDLLRHKKYPEAKEKLLEIIKLAREIKSYANIVNSYTKLLNIYLATDDFFTDKEAVIFVDSLKANIPKLKANDISHYQAFFILSYYYDIQGDSALAFKYGYAALSVAKNYGTKRNEVGAYQNLFEVYKSAKQYEQAILMLDSAYLIKDEIFKDKSLAKLQELETKFKTEKAVQEKELAEHQERLAKTETQAYRNSLIALIGVLLLVLLSIGFYVWQYRLRKQKELMSKELTSTQKRLEVEQQFRKAELKALKAQLNPHFMFNALNSIQDYILLNEKELASDYLGKFADLMRIYLNHSQEGNLSLEEEIEALELYLDLESVRFDHSIEFSITADEDLDIEVLKIPTMLVQPYVENSIKHGLFYKKGERHVHIHFHEYSDEYIEAIVKDNGIGRVASAKINAHRNPNHKSFATSANATRLELLNHGRNEKIEVKFIDLYQNEEATGTEVRILIPLKQTA